jgi:predicted RNA methylase
MRALAIAFLAVSAVSPAFSQYFGGENLGPDVPTPQIVVDRMLEAGRVKPGDTVYDLGSGDGRIVITAAQKFGARAVGVEIRPDLCRRANERIQALGLAGRVKVIEASALHVDLSPANVVTMVLLTDSNERLKPNLEKYLKPGSHVVSNQFPIRGWRPAEIVRVKVGKMDHVIYVYEMGKNK